MADTARDSRAVRPITVMRQGSGPEVLLVHGGASPATTWSGLAVLRSRWTLAAVHRRGFAPSPSPPGGRQDFDLDADDLAALLDRRPHIVAHSYGALGAVIAVARKPAQVRSLTLIEPPFFLPPDDPEVIRFRRMGDAVLTHGLDADPVVLASSCASLAPRFRTRDRCPTRSRAGFVARTEPDCPARPTSPSTPSETRHPHPRGIRSTHARCRAHVRRHRQLISTLSEYLLPALATSSPRRPGSPTNSTASSAPR